MAARPPQVVSTKSQRKSVITWMISTVESCGMSHSISAKAVEQFPTVFKWADPKQLKACRLKAYR